MEIARLIKITCDNMENIDPINEKEIACFTESLKKGLTAQGVAAKYISGMKPCEHYLGNDGEIYPKYKLIITHTTEII